MTLTASVVALLLIPQSRLGDSLLRYGFYSEAAAEYRRSSCLTGRSTDELLRLGLSLAGAGDLSEAVPTLRLVSEQDSGLAWDATMALAGLYARRHEFARARFELSSLLLGSPDSARTRKLQFLCGWLDLQSHDLSSARSCFSQADRQDLVQAIEDLGPARSPAAATIMSSVVPGLGEVCAGRPLSGLLGFTVTGTSACAAYLSARSGDWVLAAVLVSTFFLRFYNGSRQNASLFANEWNHRRVTAMLERLEAAGTPEPDWFEGVRPIVGPEFPAGQNKATSRPGSFREKSPGQVADELVSD
jgi:tetratricopeptide (TPR) repeat protein